MPSKQIYFDEEEEKKIKQYALKWSIAEYEVVRKIIREFKDKK